MIPRSAIVCLVFLCAARSSLCAQERTDTTAVDPARTLERTLEDATQDTDDSQLFDLLNALMEHPLEVNLASQDELTQIPGITPVVAFNIVTRRRTKPFGSVEQLLEVEGVTEELYSRIRQFLRVENRLDVHQPLPFSSLNFRTRSVQDLQERRGFSDGSFKGSSLKVYNRLTIGSQPFGRQRSSLDIGVVMEKDAGESSLANFLAGYLRANAKDLSTRFILGDFTLEAGEGLVFSRSLGLSKGSEVISSAKKSGVGIRPYLSTDENWYFRGVAAEADISSFTLSAFYSSKPLHASVNPDGAITSFYSSGLFRTDAELLRRSTARATVVGGTVVAVPMEGFRVGGSAYGVSFNRDVQLADAFDFRGRDASMVGLDISLSRSTFAVFSEAARSPSKRIGAIAGVVSEPIKGLAFTLVGRTYPKDFVSLFGNGFGESGSTQNETGIYAGARARVFQGLTVSAYFDQFVVPWKSRLAVHPSRGNDLLLLGEVELSRRFSLQLQYKHRRKPIGELSSDVFGRVSEVIGERRQTNYRATLEYRSSTTFRARSRVEVVNVSYQHSPSIERGFLAFQDVRIYPLPRLLINARVMVFETDSFNSRVYEFENDVRGTFTNPGLFGRGVRWYAVMRYEIANFIDVWLKYAHIMKDGVRVLSSGSSQIQGNLDNRVTIQMDVVL